jgi:hypothetical protein
MVTCSFHAFRFEMAIIFGVPISLTVCTLSNISFVFGLLKFDFALLYVFYIEYVLVIRCRLKTYKKRGGRIDVVIIDFSKVFDSVPHDRLFTKIEASGVDSRAAVWIGEFLLGRTQRVRMRRILE